MPFKACYIINTKNPNEISFGFYTNLRLIFQKYLHNIKLNLIFFLREGLNENPFLAYFSRPKKIVVKA
jgi:hypothetical protein